MRRGEARTSPTQLRRVSDRDSGHRPGECQQRGAHAVAEGLDVGAGIPVDGNDGELPGVAEGTDTEGEVDADRHDRDHLEQRGAGQEHGLRWAGHVGDRHVHVVLAGGQAPGDPLDPTARNGVDARRTDDPLELESTISSG